MDIHEPPFILNKLKSFGLEVEVENLKIGDYTWNEVCIERKTMNDFFNSLYYGKKRLWNQAYMMMQNYKWPIFLIEGNLIYPFNQHTFRQYTTFLQAASTLTLKFNMHLFQTRDLNSTVDLIAILYKTSGRGGKLKPVEKKLSSPAEIREDILTRFPGIGRKIARQLLKRHCTLKNIFNLPIETLTQIQGISKQKAWKMKEILEGDI